MNTMMDRVRCTLVFREGLPWLKEALNKEQLNASPECRLKPAVSATLTL
ncbi:hypothetical protein IHQ11_01465 [Priestia megaterium]|nr:hypothetical protein [Priestia megaterium]MBQ4865173.1 hypothetical protein [Priestia megaterium]